MQGRSKVYLLVVYIQKSLVNLASFRLSSQILEAVLLNDHSGMSQTSSQKRDKKANNHLPTWTSRIFYGVGESPSKLRAFGGVLSGHIMMCLAKFLASKTFKNKSPQI